MGMFAIGQSITLEYKGMSLKTHLRGWKVQKSGYLLVDPPTFGEGTLRMEPGVDVIARTKRKSSMYGLVTKSSHLLRKTNLVVLKLMEEIQEHSVRSEERYPCLLPVIIEQDDDGNGKNKRGMICDISISGARLLTNDHLRKKDSLKLTFSLGSAGMINHQRIKVLRTVLLREKYEYAGQFLGMRNDEKQKLIEFFKFIKEWMLEE